MMQYMTTIGWILLMQIMGAIFGIITTGNIDNGWYSTLHKSPFSPPNYIFGIVWPILYCCLGVVADILWKNRNNKSFCYSFYAFFIHLILNWLWTPFFFDLHWLLTSLISIFIMIALSIFIIYDMRYKNQKVSLFMLPYVSWLMFASYLNAFVWLYN